MGFRKRRDLSQQHFPQDEAQKPQLRENSRGNIPRAQSAKIALCAVKHERRIFLTRCSKILMPGPSFFPSFLPSFREDSLRDYFPLRLPFVRRLILSLVRFSSGVSFPVQRFIPTQRNLMSTLVAPSLFAGENPERRSKIFKYNWISNFIPFNGTYYDII